MSNQFEENQIRSLFLESQARMMNVIAAIDSEVQKLEESEKGSPYILARKKNQIESIIKFNNAVEDLLFSKSTEIELLKVELLTAKSNLQMALKEQNLQQLHFSELLSKRREKKSKITRDND